MEHALHVAEKSPSRSPARTPSHGPMIMRQAAPASRDILQPKADRCACGGICPRCLAQRATGRQLSRPDDVAEREADAMAHAAMVDARTPQELALSLAIDPASVTLRADARAAASARAIGARAYALGSQIVFGSGEYAPDTTRGRRLLAHELAHVAQQRRSGVPRLQRAGIGEAKLADEWIVRMRALRDAALGKTMKPDQEQEFVDGLNEVIVHNPRSLTAGVVLPVKIYPGPAELEDGHVYFEKGYHETPAVTRLLCKPTANSTTAVEAKRCNEDRVGGNAIIIGPTAVLETEAYTRTIFDHEALHYYLAWEPRNRQEGKDRGWSEAVSSSDQAQQSYNEEALTYAEQFSAIFAMSDRERYSTVNLWTKYYSYASSSAREISREIIDSHLVRAYAGVRPDSGPLRVELFKAQECCATQQCRWRCNNAEDSYAAVANAMYDIRTVLDNLEGKTE